jgi:3',5'-cyclic AMP phosphodiesterase CpdA
MPEKIVPPNQLSLRIAHLSDLHLLDSRWSWSALRSKRWVALWNQRINPHRRFTTEPLDKLPEQLCQWQVDWVLMTGDWVATGETEEYVRAGQFADRLAQAGLKLLTVPGNHDQYTQAAYRKERFYQTLSPYCFPTHPVGSVPLNNRWTAIGLDTAVPRSCLDSRGSFTAAMEASLRPALELEQQLIILNHYPLFSSGKPWRDLVGCKRLQQLLYKRSNVRLYLHGHNHKTTITQQPCYPPTLDCGSATLLPEPTLRLLDLGETECTTQLAQWIDGNWQLKPSLVL